MTDVTQFPPRGLVYFWILNDECELSHLRDQIRAFAEAGVGGVVLHPRSGLLMPYGGRDWFELIGILIDDLLKAGIQPWLYDEDPYPSGSAGGRLIAENPGWQARYIERYSPANTDSDENLLICPTGKVLWAGALPPEGSDDAPLDLTDRVGTIRRHWEVRPWDSRFYYPDTPLYQHPRSDAYMVEYALRLEHVPEGWEPVMFIARPVGGRNIWGGLIDTLNPEATQAFIDHTYEAYARITGDRLGREVPAIFTDEPKYFGCMPYTDGLFESFQERFGYDLRPRLQHLFTGTSSQAMLTRIHYRQWAAERFDQAWLKPVADWCEQHDVAFVGHMSPEDDPVEQVYSLTNLMPIEKRLSLAGLDLIIPAVGDAEHALINIGPITAVSVAQQQGKPTAMSETLAASGFDFTAREAARVVCWQILMGVGSIVVHMAMASTLGLRRCDAPPDYGPDSKRWPGMCGIDQGIRPIQDAVINSQQTAPVGVLWTIRSFAADELAPGYGGSDAQQQRRDDIANLLLACHQAQVGVHLIDEADLQQAQIETADDGSRQVRVGQCRYERLLLPSATVLHVDTLAQLAKVREAGIPVQLLGQAPTLSQSETDVTPIADDTAAWDAVNCPGDLKGWTQWCRDHLPRVLPVSGDGVEHVRATGWTHTDQTTIVTMNIDASATVRLALDGQLNGNGAALALAPGEVVLLQPTDTGYRETYRFNPASLPDDLPTPTPIPAQNWQVKFDSEPWHPAERPQAAYQLRPHMRDPQHVLHMGLTGTTAIGSQPVGESLSYRTTLADMTGEITPDSRIILHLEPTLVRGQFKLEVGNESHELKVRDTDTKAIEIDLTQAYAGGARELTFTFVQPDLRDGIRYDLPVELHQPDALATSKATAAASSA